jgi:hypothetical protein
MSLIAGNLAVVQRTLDAAEISWGVYAGAAVWVYGHRRPINNVDIVVASGSLQSVSKLLQEGNRTVQYDGSRLLWRGINIYDDATIRQLGKTYPFALDELMLSKLRRLPLLGSRVLVLAPEDVIAHNLILSSGADKVPQHMSDADGIAKRQKLDVDYLRERLRIANAGPEIVARLTELGITSDAV